MTPQEIVQYSMFPRLEHGPSMLEKKHIIIQKDDPDNKHNRPK